MTTVEQNKQTRFLCKETGRLIVRTDESGVWAWCLYTKKPELIPWEQFFVAYEKTKGQSVQCTGESDDTASTTVA